MPDDEPLDDLRAVAMAGGTAAARVVETLARELRESRQREQDRQAAQQAAQARQLAQQYAEQQPSRRQTDRVQTGPQTRQPDELTQAEAWAKRENPERLAAHQLDRDYADTADGRDSAKRDLVPSWQDATVPPEAREARAVADRMNGTDPAGAAASASTAQVSKATPTKVARRERANGR